jgi:hypothetical protein
MIENLNSGYDTTVNRETGTFGANIEIITMVDFL